MSYEIKTSLKLPEWFKSKPTDIWIECMRKQVYAGAYGPYNDIKQTEKAIAWFERIDASQGAISDKAT